VRGKLPRGNAWTDEKTSCQKERKAGENEGDGVGGRKCIRGGVQIIEGGRRPSRHRNLRRERTLLHEKEITGGTAWLAWICPRRLLGN